MAEPLTIQISNYTTVVTKNDVDGSVTLEVEIGFPFGSQKFTIPAAEWKQVVEYVEQA